MHTPIAIVIIKHTITFHSEAVYSSDVALGSGFASVEVSLESFEVSFSSSSDSDPPEV